MNMTCGVGENGADEFGFVSGRHGCAVWHLNGDGSRGGSAVDDGGINGAEMRGAARVGDGGGGM